MCVYLSHWHTDNHDNTLCCHGYHLVALGPLLTTLWEATRPNNMNSFTFLLDFTCSAAQDLISDICHDMSGEESRRQTLLESLEVEPCCWNTCRMWFNSVHQVSEAHLLCSCSRISLWVYISYSYMFQRQWYLHELGGIPSCLVHSASLYITD